MRFPPILRTAVWLSFSAAALMAQAPAPAPSSAPAKAPASTAAASSPASAAPGLVLTLNQAEQRARANSPAFQAAVTAVGVAQNTHTQAQAALLPSLIYHNNYYWTQDNIYVANDGPHEFMSLGDVHEAFDFGSAASIRRARYGVALAQAQRQVAARGLFATVVQGYYTLLSNNDKVATARQAVNDANKYLSDSQKLEQAGEVAHADVIKAEIQVSQSQSALADAQLAQQQAKLALAVLIFPNYNTNFTVANDLDQAPTLPLPAQLQAAAGVSNPVLASARDAAAQAKQDVTIARASLLPSATIDYLYGIDAHEFALKNQYGHTNLGNAVYGTLAIPLFDWGSNRAKLHIAQLNQAQSQRQLAYTQRALQANLSAYYAEAQTAYTDLARLSNARNLAAQSLHLVALRYQDGQATILELVDAQNTLTLARNAYDDGQVRYRVALAALQTLTGTY